MKALPPAKYPTNVGTILAKASGNVAVTKPQVPVKPTAAAAAPEEEKEVMTDTGAAPSAQAKTTEQLLAEIAGGVGAEAGAALGVAVDAGTVGAAKLKILIALISQLEARIRDLEQAAYTVLSQKADAPAPRKAIQVGKRYSAVVKVNPKGHGLGSPLPPIALAYMQGIVEQALPPLAGEDVVVRRFALIAFTKWLGTVSPDTVEEVVKHFVCVEAYKENMAKTVICIKGEIALPVAAAIPEWVAAEEAAKGGDDTALKALCASVLVIEDGLPRAPPKTRVYEIVRIPKTVVCQTGGTCPHGRAPPGPLVRKLRGRRGRGKGKGKGVEAEDDLELPDGEDF